MTEDEFTIAEDNEIEPTQEDISEILIHGEIELDHKQYGKIKIKLLLTWS